MTKTIKDIALAWKSDKRRYVKQSTYAAYALILENHIMPTFGSCEALSEKLVQEFVLQKLEAGLSVKTVRDILIVLKMVMKFGVKNEWMPYSEWDIKYPATEVAKEPQVLSVAQHKKILDYIKQNFTFRNLGIYISLTTGLRIGESRHTELIVNTPKTKNSCREIPMSRELLSMVKPLRKVVNADYYVLTNEPAPTEPRTYRNYYHKLMERLGLPRLKYHGLRHSFATRCIESNCDYKTVSVLLGHANITTTLNLYVHPNMEQKKRCISRMLKSLDK